MVSIEKNSLWKFNLFDLDYTTDPVTYETTFNTLPENVSNITLHNLSIYQPDDVAIMTTLLTVGAGEQYTKTISGKTYYFYTYTGNDTPYILVEFTDPVKLNCLRLNELFNRDVLPNTEYLISDIEITAIFFDASGNTILSDVMSLSTCGENEGTFMNCINYPLCSKIKFLFSKYEITSSEKNYSKPSGQDFYSEEITIKSGSALGSSFEITIYPNFELQGIRHGNPIDDIKNVEIHAEHSHSNEDLTVGSLTFDVVSETDFNIPNDVALTVWDNDDFYGVYFVDDCKRQSEYVYHINAHDYIGKLDNVNVSSVQFGYNSPIEECAYQNGVPLASYCWHRKSTGNQLTSNDYITTKVRNKYINEDTNYDTTDSTAITFKPSYYGYLEKDASLREAVRALSFVLGQTYSCFRSSCVFPNPPDTENFKTYSNSDIIGNAVFTETVQPSQIEVTVVQDMKLDRSNNNSNIEYTELYMFKGGNTIGLGTLEKDSAIAAWWFKEAFQTTPNTHALGVDIVSYNPFKIILDVNPDWQFATGRSAYFANCQSWKYLSDNITYSLSDSLQSYKKDGTTKTIKNDNILINRWAVFSAFANDKKDDLLKIRLKEKYTSPGTVTATVKYSGENLGNIVTIPDRYGNNHTGVITKITLFMNDSQNVADIEIMVLNQG